MIRFWLAIVLLTAVATGSFVEAASAQTTPVDAGVVIDAKVRATSDRLAMEYAGANDYGDACAGQQIAVRVVTNADEYVGFGVRGFVQPAVFGCTIFLDADIMVDAKKVCLTYAHERLHLARGDSWHDINDRGHPLYARNGQGGDDWPACVAAFDDSFTAREARAAVRRYVPTRRLEFISSRQEAGERALSTMKLAAVRRGRATRIYVVTRPAFGAALTVRRIR